MAGDKRGQQDLEDEIHNCLGVFGTFENEKETTSVAIKEAISSQLATNEWRGQRAVSNG